MRNEVHAEHSAKILRFPATEPVRRRQRTENDIETRLQDLGNLINGLLAAPYPALLGERKRIRETLEELTVREATLRWLVRVVRSTEGAVQEKLWSEIDRALTDLEKIAESAVEP